MLYTGEMDYMARKKVSSILTLPLLMLMICGTSVFAQNQSGRNESDWSYFRSNAIGMALEPLSPQSDDKERAESEERAEDKERAEGEEWVLKRRRTSPGEVEEILLKDGERHTRTVRQRSGSTVTELEFRDGEKIREMVFEKGRPVYEWELGEEGEVSERKYEWDEGSLLSTRESVGGKETERNYLTGSDGMLRQVRRNGRISNYEKGDRGRIRSEWHRRDGTVESVRYGEEGSYLFESFRNGELARRRRSSFEGGRQRIEIWNVMTGERITEVYNEAGRIVERVVRNEDGYRNSSFDYDGGLLQEKRVRSQNSDRLFRYRYDEDDELSWVEVFEQGELSKEIRYLPEDRRVETVFREGEALYRNFYRGGELLRRERPE